MQFREQIKKINKDKSGYIFIKLLVLRQYITSTFLSAYMQLLAKCKGVKLGSGLTFKGTTYFERLPNSSITIGDNCIFNSSFVSNNVGILSRCRVATLTQTASIEIGENVGMSAVTIAAAKRICIGKGTLIGSNVLITDTDWHSLVPEERTLDIEYAKSKDIIIGSNVFIGTRSIILKGVTIGDNSVIGAGSVVSGSIPENVIAVGNPCKIVRKL